MQNLAIFHESNKDAAYYRQQVSERGILEIIDDLNEGFLEIEGVTVENLPLIYEVLNKVEISLNKNANDPRTRMALQKFTYIVDEKVEEKAPATEDDDTKAKLDPADEIQELTDESTDELNLAENTGGSTNETQKPTTEPIGEPATKQQELTSESDLVEKMDTQEPTGEPATEQQELTGEPDPAEKVDATEPTDKSAAETPEQKNEQKNEPKKSGRRKKDAE